MRDEAKRGICITHLSSFFFLLFFISVSFWYSFFSASFRFHSIQRNLLTRTMSAVGGCTTVPLHTMRRVWHKWIFRKVYDDTCYSWGSNAIVEWRRSPKTNKLADRTEWWQAATIPHAFVHFFFAIRISVVCPLVLDECVRLDACNTVIPRCLFKWSILFDKLRWSARCLCIRTHGCVRIYDFYHIFGGL